MFLLPPVTSIHAGAHYNRLCERERENTRSVGIREDRSNTNFGLVWVQTPAACMAGECFIHCVMPLGRFYQISIAKGH